MNILITGANSGFGRLTVKTLISRGHRVIGSMRDVWGRNAMAAQELQTLGMEAVEIDVTSNTSVEEGVTRVLQMCVSIDVLINNAGVGAHGLQENFSDEDLRRLFDINVFGVQRMIRAVVPSMRERRSGLLVNISSLLGRVALPFYGPYNASKWALEALSENYRAELSQHGVDVVVIEPGGFPTGFIGNLMQPSSTDRNPTYGDLAQAPRASLEHFEQFLAANPQQDPQLVANAVADVIDTEAGRRAFRTEVDRIGMADAIRPVNELHAEITRGLFSNLGMGDLLALQTGS